jgi:AcrR family transcriptional regulator
MAKSAKAGTGSSPGLTRAGIVAAALTLIDREGLENFSLRNLARDLGVTTTAIYWHLPGRNVVLAEVVSSVIAGVSPPPQADWRVYLRMLMRNLRDALRRHPNAAPLLGAQLVSNIAASLDLVEGILEALTTAGFAGRHLVAAYNAVAAAMVGFVTQELSPMPEDAPAWQAIVRARLDAVQADAHPLIAANMALLANRAFILRWENGVAAPMDDGFDLFVEAFITGLDSQPRGKP